MSETNPLNSGELDVVRFVQEAPDVLERLKAAEEVCWAITLAISVGLLECVPMGTRDMIGKPLEVWADLCVKTGIMRKEEESETN